MSLFNPKETRSAEMLRRARSLRKRMTPAEEVLWNLLRARRFEELRVRRQQIIGTYIVDFFIAQEGLIIEVDGEIHRTTEARDLQRDRWLEQRGYRVLRIPNEVVVHDPKEALQRILNALNLP